MIITHVVVFSGINADAARKLKWLANSITDISGGEHAVTHSESNAESCPICKAGISSRHN